MFDNGNVNLVYAGEGILVLNQAFLCQTMHLAGEPGFFVSNECYDNKISHAKMPRNMLAWKH